MSEIPVIKDPQVPHSDESERAVVGCILLTGSTAEVDGLVAVADFYHPAMRSIFEACVELSRASKPIDSAAVVEEMRGLGTIDHLRAFDGPELLSDLAFEVATPETAAYHARIVAQKATRRRWLAGVLSVLKLGYSDRTADADFFADAERTMVELSQGRPSDRGPRHIKPILREFVRDLEERYKRAKDGTVITGIPTGLHRFDEITSGLQRGDLIIIGARPSMGKTSLSLAACDGAAQTDARVLVCSCEMSAPSLVERLISSDGRVDGARLRSGALETAHWVRISGATSRLAERGIWIDDDGSVTVDEIRSRARRWRAKDGAGKDALIIVDYVQLIEADFRKGRSREQEVSAISRGLKALAKELDCPVLALAQLNRDLEKRPDKRPRMADLRDSGGIEQDADVIAFLYRDEVYSGDECKPEDKGVAEIIVAKQRRGPTGVVRVAWLPEYCRFDNLARQS